MIHITYLFTVHMKAFMGCGAERLCIWGLGLKDSGLNDRGAGRLVTQNLDCTSTSYCLWPSDQYHITRTLFQCFWKAHSVISIGKLVLLIWRNQQVIYHTSFFLSIIRSMTGTHYVYYPTWFRAHHDHRSTTVCSMRSHGWFFIRPFEAHLNHLLIKLR